MPRQPKTRRMGLSLHGGSTGADGRLELVVTSNLEALTITPRTLAMRSRTRTPSRR